MSAENQVIEELPDEDAVLAYVHQKRLGMISSLMKDGKVPADQGDAKIVVSLLKDMSADALGRKRLKVDEKVVDEQANANRMIAHVLHAAAQHKPWVATTPQDRPIPVLGSEVPRPDLVAGETDPVGSAYQETYESFTVRTSAKT